MKSQGFRRVARSASAGRLLEAFGNGRTRGMIIATVEGDLGVEQNSAYQRR